MGKEILKWLTSLGLGIATAGLAWAQGSMGSGPAVDPLVAGLVVAVLSKVINYLASKIPTQPTL